jgi:DNA-binding transcriptional LysR family regulator
MVQAEPRFYYKGDRLKQLRAFCTAADVNSISLAGQRMHLSQSSISLLVKALERDMDVTLFERRGRRIRITDAGRLLLQLARPLVDGLDSLPQVFAERRGRQLADRLSIGAGPSTMMYLLPDVVRRFVERYPTTQVSLRHAIGQEAIELLRTNEVDLVLGTLLEIPADITYRPVLPYSPVLITPPEHPLNRMKRPITLQEIARYPLIRPPERFTTWQIIEAQFQQHMVPYRVAMEASDWEVILEFVERGLGIAIVTSICLSGREKLRVLPLDHYFTERSYGLILRQGRHVTTAVRRFIEILDTRGSEG